MGCLQLYSVFVLSLSPILHIKQCVMPSDNGKEGSDDDSAEESEGETYFTRTA